MNTGINYEKNQVDQVDFSPIFPNDILKNIGSSPVYNSWFQDDFSIHYIGLPLELKYKLLGEVKHMYLVGGVNPLFKIFQNRESYVYPCGENPILIDNSNIGNEPAFFVMLVRAGIGFETHLADTKIFLEPRISYSTNGILKKRGIVSDLTNNSKLLKFGLRLGVRI